MYSVYDIEAKEIVKDSLSIEDAIMAFVKIQIDEAKEQAKFLILDAKLRFVGMMFWARKDEELVLVVNNQKRVRFYNINGEMT